LGGAGCLPPVGGRDWRLIEIHRDTMEIGRDTVETLGTGGLGAADRVLPQETGRAGGMMARNGFLASAS
jgi:hypothetical protein